MRRRRQGQSTVEWALVLSVLVIAVVAAAYVLVPGLSTSLDAAGRAMAEVYTSGRLAGS